MLHELFLSLFGTASPLFSNEDSHNAVGYLLSPSEKALLRKIAQLGALHKFASNKASKISAQHPSTICRAVAAAITSNYLGKYEEHIVNVERSILQEEPQLVGAYTIVPLASIANSFHEWSHIFQWLNLLLKFIEFDHQKPGGEDCDARNGAQLLDWLRAESKTGHLDIETIALSLTRVGETAWLRQVSSWLLYGRLPKLGAEDFFIQHEATQSSRAQSIFVIKPRLLPNFVFANTSKSILFMGKLLNHIQASNTMTLHGPIVTPGAEISSLRHDHLKELLCLHFPISSADLARAVQTIRSSLTHNVIQKLLPISSTLQILDMLQQFFLLGRGEFALAMVGAIDECMQSQSRSFSNTQGRNASALGGMMIKEADLSNVMTKTWKKLANLQDYEISGASDGDLDMARGLVHLSIKRHSSKAAVLNDSVWNRTYFPSEWLDDMFENVLFGTPVVLNLVPPSPFNLFLTNTEITIYSYINSYLMSVRRAHLHLTGLWKLNILRRTSSIGLFAEGAQPFPLYRSACLRDTERSKIMRSTWAIASSISFFLAEMGEYLQGEVLKSSWTTFREWYQNSLLSDGAINRTGVNSGNATSKVNQQGHSFPTAFHDPEVLMVAHRHYLSGIVHELCLDDLDFKIALGTLLTCSDHVVALMERLGDVLLSLKDIQYVVPTSIEHSHILQEEQDLLKELKAVEISLKTSLEDLIDRLRMIDSARKTVDLKQTEPIDTGAVETGFVCWRGPGVGRLLMKLESGRTTSNC